MFEISNSTFDANEPVFEDWEAWHDISNVLANREKFPKLELVRIVLEYEDDPRSSSTRHFSDEVQLAFEELHSSGRLCIKIKLY
jgi:hypothetical protein